MKEEMDMDKLNSKDLAKVSGGAGYVEDLGETDTWLAKCETYIRIKPSNQARVLKTVPRDDRIVVYMGTTLINSLEGIKYCKTYYPCEGWVKVDDLYK